MVRADVTHAHLRRVIVDHAGPEVARVAADDPVRGPVRGAAVHEGVPERKPDYRTETDLGQIYRRNRPRRVGGVR